MSASIASPRRYNVNGSRMRNIHILNKILNMLNKSTMRRVMKRTGQRISLKFIGQWTLLGRGEWRKIEGSAILDH